MKKAILVLLVTALMVVVLFYYVVNTPLNTLERAIGIEFPPQTDVVKYYKDNDDTVLAKLEIKNDAYLRNFIKNVRSNGWIEGSRYSAYVFNDYIEWWHFDDKAVFDNCYYFNGIKKLDGFPVPNTYSIFITGNFVYVAKWFFEEKEMYLIYPGCEV